MKKLFFLLIIIFGCEPERDYPKMYNIKNNSSRTIYFGLSYSQTDFSLKSVNFVPGVDGNTSRKIKPKEQNTARVGSSIMQVYIFDADVIEKTRWDTIVKYNMFLQRYQFTRSELENMNWEVVYDGN